MKKLLQKGAALILTAAMMLSLHVTAFAAVTQGDLQKAVDESAAYMLNAVKDPQVGSIGGEWAVLGLARSGYNVPQSYYDK